MNKPLKFGLIGLGTIALLATAWIGKVLFTYQHDYSSTPLPNITASQDPAVIARGEYVVHAIAHCSACHAPAESFSQRVLSEDKRDLSGGGHFPAGPFGDYYAANLSSDEETGIGRLSDGQLARAIRHGVDRNGRYAAFMALAVGNMADEDLTAVVSFLRTLPAKKRVVPADEWGFLAKALSSSFTPRSDDSLTYVPPGAASVERGSYIANGPGACYLCHTPRDPMQGFAENGPRFSGNPEPEPDETDDRFVFLAPNLTPDPTSLLAVLSEDNFVARLNQGRVFAGSTMPWENLQQLTEDDKRSVYRYLKTLSPTPGPSSPGRRPKDSL